MTRSNDPDGTSDRTKADLTELLNGLAETVRYRLAAAATSPYLQAELNSLASILRILATEGPALHARAEADHADLARLLEQLGHTVPATTEQRRGALADIASGARGGRTRARIREYITRDLDRGIVGLMDTWASPAVSRPRTGAADARARPAAGELRRRLVAFAQAEGLGEVTSIEHATEGYGAETVVCSTAAPGRSRFVVRIQWSDLPIARLIQPVTNQAHAITAAAGADVALAPVRLVRAHAETVGAPVLVTGFVEGYTPTTWTAEGREFTRRLSEHAWLPFVRDLVRIHGAPLDDVQRAALRLGPTTREHQVARVDALTRVYRSCQLRPDPLIEEVLAFLREGVAEWGEPVLVHGDYRPGNIRYRDDLTPTAVLDWDCAVVNDFHEDLGHIVAWPWRDREGRACGLRSREELLETYARLSGREVDRHAVDYYEVQSALRRYLGFAGLARAWLDDGGDIRMARAWLALANDRRELGRLLSLAG